MEIRQERTRWKILEKTDLVNGKKEIDGKNKQQLNNIIIKKSSIVRKGKTKKSGNVWSEMAEEAEILNDVNIMIAKTTGMKEKQKQKQIQRTTSERRQETKIRQDRRQWNGMDCRHNKWDLKDAHKCATTFLGSHLKQCNK